MKFGMFYEIQVPKPWHEDKEFEIYRQVLDQAQLADEVGFDSFWTVEHHFFPEFSHCSAPEVLYGAVSQRTKNIRIGHGVVLLPFPYLREQIMPDFTGVPEREVYQMVADNAAQLYGLDG